MVPAKIDGPEALYTGQGLATAAMILTKHFGKNSLRPPKTKVASHLALLDPEGFLLPQSWLNSELGMYQPSLARLEALHRHFRLTDFLAEVQQRMFHPHTSGHPPGLIALYHYLPAYFNMLKLAERGAAVTHRLFPSKPLKQLLLAEQLMELSMMAARAAHGGYETYTELNQLVATAGQEARTFFETHGNGIMAAAERALRGLPFNIANEEGADADVSETVTTLTATEAAFYATHQTDLATLRLRALFARPIAYQLPTETIELINDKLGATLAATALFDRIATYQPSTAPAQAPKISRAEDEIGGSDERKINTVVAALTPEERAAILTAVPKSATVFAKAAKRYAGHLTALLNRLTEPLQSWRTVGDRTEPHFGQIDRPALTKKYQNFVTSREVELRETKKLEECIAHLPNVKDRKTLARTAEDVTFGSKEMRQRYAAAVAKRESELSETDRYREEKLREYGIEAPELSDREMDIYLNEILRIEKEVTPFIAFVRDAFKAALPIQSKLKFNGNRHSIDGPEFDPDTLADPEKYLRGEVMKTFRTDSRTVPIVQVNAFCLDYSKSMILEPMRNLYKVMFLLILGLEGRGTYDAVYFFSEKFMEVADFRGLTDRKVLWPILRTVSNISAGEVRYSGDGYTNISAGLDESHRRLNEYADYLKKKHPGVHLVRSLFMLTDGEPNAGIWEPEKLRDHVEAKRDVGPVAIKGIFFDTGVDAGETISDIFGSQHSVQADSFESVVVNFVGIMSETYKRQRSYYRRNLKNQHPQTTV